MVVVGETGTLVSGYHSVELYRKGQMAPEMAWSNDVSRETATYEGMNHLLTSLETGVEAPNSARDNLKTVAILDAAYRSARDQRTIKLDRGVLV